MKTTALLLALASASLCRADEAAPPSNEKLPGIERLLKRFDANGDGKLDETERAKARESVRGRRGGAIHQRVLDRFDEDKDGKLSDAERAKAKEALQKRRAGRAGKTP